MLPYRIQNTVALSVSTDLNDALDIESFSTFKKVKKTKISVKVMSVS